MHMLASAAADICHDPHEAWGPVSRLRPFDLTPCFEQGVVLSSILVIFTVFAVFRCYTLRHFDVFPRCRKSVLVLRSKLVRIPSLPRNYIENMHLG